MAASVAPQHASSESDRQLKCRNELATTTGTETWCRPAESHERSQALALFYRDRTPRCREALFHWARRLSSSTPHVFSGLYVAKRRGEMHGAVWARVLPGRQIHIWSPVLAPGEPPETLHALMSSLDPHLDESGCSLVYASLQEADDPHVLIGNGFQYITEMGRLVCPLPADSRDETRSDLTFEPYTATQADRLKRVLQRAGEDSLDCPALRGLRHIDDVLEGHLNREDYLPAHWRIIRRHGRDVGCLLISRHQHSDECEVVYVGLASEARNQGLGAAVIRHAQFLSHLVGARVLTLGCDVNNTPAMRTYLRAGFREVERWSLFAKSYGCIEGEQ